MNKKTADYIFYCMEKDSVNAYGTEYWCEDRDIDISDFNKFEDMVLEMINHLED